MVELRLYVEGGGDSTLLRTQCRRGFSEFLPKAGLKHRMPRVVACGTRRQAYDDFCTALTQNTYAAMLLVDSEDAFMSKSVWEHLRNRPGDCWTKPDRAEDEDCHLMVQCMESWFLADRAALVTFYGQGFNDKALPADVNALGAVAKQVVYDALAKATAKCKTKAPYGKGEHSFKILSLIDPSKVRARLPSADAFIGTLASKMAG